MEKIKRLYEDIYERRICNQFDHILPVVGDEGMGKSTFILESAILWQEIKDGEHDPDAILDSLIYDREGLQNALASFDRRSVICIPDAARVLHKKEAMKGEQIEIEKDFFDVRTKEYLILLGFQDWNSIPSFLQKRRAKNLIYIPRRGVVRGFNRSSLNKRVDSDKWPPADLRDTFPALDGTDIWEEYKEIDRQKKDERMGVDSDDEEDELTPQDVVKEIKSNGTVQDYVRDLNNGATIVDADLVYFDYDDLSKPESEQVKKVLERDVDIEKLSKENESQPELATDGGGPPA